MYLASASRVPDTPVLPMRSELQRGGWEGGEEREGRGGGERKGRGGGERKEVLSIRHHYTPSVCVQGPPW